jgi:hypothetical protein
MPETKPNGYSNGNHIHNGYEMEENSSFLFTSESVGEGHPGKNKSFKRIHFVRHISGGERKFPRRGGKKKTSREPRNVKKRVVISDS